jgi:hypothetical protein
MRRRQSVAPEDDSGTIRLPSRQAVVIALRSATADPTVVGDLALARDLAALLSHLLGRKP